MSRIGNFLDRKIVTKDVGEQTYISWREALSYAMGRGAQGMSTSMTASKYVNFFITDVLHSFHTIHPRHHMIHKYHIIIISDTQADCFLSRRCCTDFHSISSEDSSCNTKIHWLIIYHKSSDSVAFQFLLNRFNMINS